MKKLQDIEAIIFDMDGVIFDTEKIWKKAFHVANKKFKTKFSEKFRRNLCGLCDKETRLLLKQECTKVDADAFRDFIVEYVKDYENTKIVPMKKGFTELISFFKEKKLKLGLATSSDKSMVEKLFKNANLSVCEIFDYIQTANDITEGKPNPMIYNKCCQGLNVNQKNVIVIEDSPNGIRASSSANCITFMVVDLIKPTKEIKKMCYKVCNTLYEIQKFL